MAARLFEGEAHAQAYRRFRFSPREGLREPIAHYLGRKAKSFQLAVDVGCGSGQGTHLLAERFEKVVGTDVSEAQIEEAKQTPHPPNVSYLVSPAEKLPFEDHSVDLVSAFTAAHWFDLPVFMVEVERILTPSGCVILCSNTTDSRLHYGDCSEKLTEIFKEFRDQIIEYASDKVKRVMDDYEEIFNSVPFQDKERITDIVDKVQMTVAELMGYIESFSMYQTYLKAQPEVAKSSLQNLEQRNCAKGEEGLESGLLQMTMLTLSYHPNGTHSVPTRNMCLSWWWGKDSATSLNEKSFRCRYAQLSPYGFGTRFAVVLFHLYSFFHSPLFATRSWDSPRSQPHCDFTWLLHITESLPLVFH